MAKGNAKSWLPQFCTLPALFAVMVVAELVVVIVLLGPGQDATALLPRIGTASVFVQWLALVCAVTLCSLREPLARFPARIGMPIAWLLIVAITTLGSALVYSFDQALRLGVSVPAGGGFRFVAGNAFIAALIAAALLRYLFVLEQWQERVEAAAKSQVDALQARIRPHFLFNSMNTIASLVRTRPADAERTVEDLADLFRAALGADDAIGTLGAELDLVDNYLRIEQLRLGERLAIERDLDDVPRDFPLPRLLIQPLVENAVYHGIQPLPEGGTIRIRGNRTPGFVEIEVRNPRPEQPAPPRNGHALENIRARIEYHFGARGELRIEPLPHAFVVTMRLPDEAIR